MRALLEAAASVGAALWLGGRGYALTAAVGAGLCFGYVSRKPVHAAVAVGALLWAVGRAVWWAASVVAHVFF